MAQIETKFVANVVFTLDTAVLEDYSSLGKDVFTTKNINYIFCSTGVNFNNVLRAAFMPVAPLSVRTQSSCQYLFTLLGSTRAKAALKRLMKLTQSIKLHLKIESQNTSDNGQNVSR